MADKLVESFNAISLNDKKFQKPFLKWVGGKTQIIKDVLNNFPKTINNYHEIFVGGGSVLFAALELFNKNNITITGNIYAYDLNLGLISLYKNIQTNPNEIHSKLSEYYSKINSITGGEINRKPNSLADAETSKESYFYWIRKQFNEIEDKTSLTYSAMFLFLNKTCFRGMYREGPSGFNVPYGHYKTFRCIEKEDLISISRLIQPVVFTCIDFKMSMDECEKNDFVYLDPPYAPEDTTSFVGYTKDGFNLKQHQLLFKMANELSDKNIKFLMSNSNVKLVRDSFTKLNITEIEARRAINSKKPQSKTTEVFIKNF